MLVYVLRRLLWMVPTMLGITFLLFVVMQLAPGDPAEVLFGDAGDLGASARGAGGIEDAIRKFREQNHLDEPIPLQYLHWVKSVAMLDFGAEFARPDVRVMDELWRRLAITVPLAVISVLLSYLIALPLGVLSAVRQRSLPDKLTTFALFLMYSVPQFWVGLMLVLVFGATGLHWLPVIGLHDKDMSPDAGWAWWRDLALHAILPVVVLTFGGLAYLSRQIRVGMLEVVRQDYIRTARAKGLSERAVILHHALRNSLIPVVTVFATLLPVLIGGSVIVELIFDIPGMGLYAYEGLLKRDYNVVMATTTISALLTLVGFLVSDILYGLVDPRISYD
ncbi:MAG TPA: ABC transporter permease [Planctomycetota bacterium]|nr:ABC transporter permease [Planctomycetota bacterium]